MDAATRRLALYVLTSAKDGAGREASITSNITVLAATTEFGEQAKKSSTLTEAKQAIKRVLTHNEELLDELVDTLEQALTKAGTNTDLGAARTSFATDPTKALKADAQKLADLVASGLSPAMRKTLNHLLDQVGAALDTVRGGFMIKPPTTAATRKKAAVFGAGIAGLTAAHELAERGFEVSVYERAGDERTGSDVPPVKLGGMAASHRAKKPSPLPTFGKEPDQDGSTSVIRAFRPLWGDPTPLTTTYPDELPGEHGFRFFPAYYLHIWDMLQRIPVTDKIGTNWELTHRTVFDNIQRVVTQATTTPVGRPSVVFPREAPRSIAELLGGIGQLRELGFKPSDVSTFTSRLARYLSTSPTRRAREFEDISAYDFFVGADSVTGQAMYDYSRAFDDQLRNMPKVLAAFDGFWGDARTNVSTYLQLQLRMDRRDNKADGVLRGPTSESWFDHWYRHLKDRLGVKFFRWELSGFDFVKGTGGAADELTAMGQPLEGTPSTLTKVDADYYVVALDAPYAEMVAEPLAAAGVGGTVKSLQGWTTNKPGSVPPLPDASKKHTSAGAVFGVMLPPGQRDPAPTGAIGPYNMQELGAQPWDRYQTLSGLQLYFDTEFQLVHGHVYFTDTPWGLSSINQTGLWEAEHRPNIPGAGYVSVLSVDIGDWNTPSPAVANGTCPEGRAAKDCSPDEIAAEVWRQITMSLANDMPRTAQTFPTPVWYLLDRSFMVGDDKDGNKRILENRAPYLVPIVSDWQNRPGGDPWNPHHSSISYRRSQAQKEKDAAQYVWAAEHGGYEVHCDSLVFAGTWARTFTRMTSMEAACESGRHAVNAILDHVVRSEIGDQRGDDVGLSWMWPFGFLDQSGSGPIRQPTPVGDYCYIFDIENREPAEFRPTRRLDREFVIMGQPHPWELGGVDALMRTTASASGGAMIDPAMPTNPYSAGFMQWIVGHLSSYRRFLESLDRQTGGTGFGAGAWGQTVQRAAEASEPDTPDDPFVPPEGGLPAGGRFRYFGNDGLDQRDLMPDHFLQRRLEGLRDRLGAEINPFNL